MSAKKLTYFKFMPAEWLTGSIQLLTDAEKGTYIDLCAMIMKEGGTLDKTNKMLARKLRIDDATLCDRIRAYTECNILVCDRNLLSVKFITDQIGFYNNVCKANKENASKRWSKKCDPMPIRIEKKRKEEKRIEENIKEKKKKVSNEIDFSIPDTFNGNVKKSLSEWLTYKSELPKAKQYKTQTGWNSFISNVGNKISKNGDEYVCHCIEFTISREYQGIVWREIKDVPELKATNKIPKRMLDMGLDEAFCTKHGIL